MKKKKAIKTSINKGETPDASPQDLIDTGIQEIESEVAAELIDRLRNSDPYYFEVVVLNLFKAMGYGDFEVTQKSGDGGIDGIINQDSLGLEKIYVQSKRYAETNLIQETHIRNFIGAMSSDTMKGIFVTTSSFSQSSVSKADSAQHKIILIDGKQLVDLMYKYGIGVQIKNTYIIKEIDEDFFITE